MKPECREQRTAVTSMSRWSRALGVALVVATLAAALLPGCSKSSRLPALKIVFQGLTNRPNGTVAAVFDVENVGPRTVVIEGYAIQVKEQARQFWHTMPPLPFAARTPLAAGSSSKFIVNYPPYDHAWRVRFSFIANPGTSVALREKLARWLDSVTLSSVAGVVRPRPVAPYIAHSKELTLKEILFPKMQRRRERPLILSLRRVSSRVRAV
jgi:hypothetical protein